MKPSGGPLGFNLAELHAEIAGFQQQWESGIRGLAGMQEVKVGASERLAVWQQDKVTLYRFLAEGETADRPARDPLLIVYALVNRPWMVDLQQGRSLVQRLLALGHDVYVIDWGSPERSDRWLELGDYINRYIDGAVRHLCKASGQTGIDVLGVCQGGVFSLCYAALHPDRVRNLITMVTPVDFQTPDNLLGHWARAVDADRLVEVLGNIPADLMNLSYLMLKPFRLNLQKYIGLVDILHDRQAVEDFLRMEQWIFDSPDLAGAAFADFVRQFYRENGLVNGTVKIDGKTVDLSALTMPVLNVYAEQDHLVPPAAAKALRHLLPPEADYAEQAFAGGHIGIYVSSRAQREVPACLDSWLRARR